MIVVETRKPTPRRWWVLALLFVCALLALVPLRLVPGLAGDNALVTAGAVSGPWWGGRFSDLRVGPLPLGSVRVGIRPLPLLLGRRELAIDRPATATEGPLHAVLATGDDHFAISEASGRVPIDGLGDLPLRGATFDGLAVTWQGGRCTAAAGTVGIEMTGLGTMLPGGLAFSGPVRCAGGMLLLPLKGPSGLERLTMRIGSSGTWTADLVIGGLPPELTAPLLDHGFRTVPGGVGLTVRGSL